MPLTVDPRKIVKAKIIPWKQGEGLYGVAYETATGWYGADKIGTRAQAEAALRSIGLQQGGQLSGVVEPFPKNVAAS